MQRILCYGDSLTAGYYDDGAKFPMNDLPKELLVLVLIAVEDQNWVRRALVSSWHL